ncbi:MAG: VWA domain-containing protein [Candidatus Solibacter sp.]
MKEPLIPQPSAFPGHRKSAAGPLSRRRLMLSPAALLASPLARAAQDVTFSTEVKVVNVLANVYGKNGEIVRDLTRDDFLLSEDGRPQAIRYFSRETDLPLTLGLMVDTSMSQRRVLDAERIASFEFVDQVLREATDHVFIVQFDLGVDIRQPLTSSRRELERALTQVDTPSLHQLELQRGGGTLLYEAIAVAARDVMRQQTGRKALIVISDGVDTGSEIPLSTAVEEAQRAGTLVYAIVFSDANAYGTPLGPLLGLGGPDGKGVLMRISRETGGRCFEVSKTLSIDRIFQAIQDELRSQYNLGFVSDVPVRISGFRRLQLTAKTKGLVVQAQSRYWAQR